MSSLDIVRLIEGNPIEKLAKTQQEGFLSKIQNNFTEADQKLFITSFYCYLNYNKNVDFVVDLDNIWKWLGFSQKVKVKNLIEKYFVLDVDYKILLSRAVKQTNEEKDGRGGSNRETIMLTIKTFKLLCLKSRTEKADQIYEYYLRLEEMLHEAMLEENADIRKQLENHSASSKIAQEHVREKTILEHFDVNTQCVYYGLIDNQHKCGEQLIKFGNSNNLRERVSSHKTTYLNFRLVNAFKVDNKMRIENDMKNHQVFIERKRELKINNKRHIEIITIAGLSFSQLDSIIQDIISKTEYSAENYVHLLSEKDELQKKYDTLSKDMSNVSAQNLLLKEDNMRLKTENIKLVRNMELYNTYKRVIEETDGELKEATAKMTTIEPIVVDEEQYNNTVSQVRRIDRSADGFYHVDGIKYPKLFGTRQEVWDRVAYKTTGCLLKRDLLINKYGKVVSKSKFISSKLDDRLHKVNEQKKKLANADAV